MSSLFDSEVTAARNRIPWAVINAASLLQDLADLGDDVTLECRARPSVRTRVWWTLRWTRENGQRYTVDAESLQLCLWRAAVREQKSRAAKANA